MGERVDESCTDSDKNFPEKYYELKNRDWGKWLCENSTFPFEAERIDDDDKIYFGTVSNQEPFGLGHKMKVVSIEMEDDLYGIIVKVREGRRMGCVPLIDLEVASEDNPNHRCLEEYAEWFSISRL